MIITIEDSPAIKHITIDIDFTGNDPITKIQKDTRSEEEKYPYTHGLKPEQGEPIQVGPVLDLDVDFEQSTTEIIEKPVIKDTEREAKVSEDMMEAEY